MFKLETDKQYNGISGAVIPDSKLENDFELALTSAHNTTVDNWKITNSVILRATIRNLVVIY